MAFTGIGSVTIALIAAAIFFPFFGQVLANFLAPIASALGNWFAMFLGDLAVGLRLMLSSVAGIIFMITVLASGVVVGHWYWPSDNVATALADLHKNFVCQPRPKHYKYVFNYFDPWTWW